ncbi:MAG TPA: ATP-binding protein [Spirochaetota bacterium]|nr:ATP-binding protein [Spirochaetota bacterium]
MLTNVISNVIFVNMIPRNLEIPVRKYASQYPVIGIVGPRQSGKTTLARHLFPDHRYLSLENLDMRQLAEEDPRTFLEDFGDRLIIDEIQRAPGLFSYLQEKVDMNDDPGRYVVTGSQQFLMMEQISQSLAGRIIIFSLYPFTTNELFLQGMDKEPYDVITINAEKKHGEPSTEAADLIFSGMYPRIHDKKLDARKWIENYILTYIERDIRSLVNVENLKMFENFIQVCASRTGQILNFASISGETGVSQPTVKRWLSLLETSGIVFLLQPYHRNFSKRILKNPKLYFIDTGIACYLLSIRNRDMLITHPLYGSLFETFVIGNMFRRIQHMGERPPLYYWRDRTGKEIDCVFDTGEKPVPIEIKSAKTYSRDFTSTLQYWKDLPGNTMEKGLVVYNGKDTIGKKEDITIVPWWRL